MVCKYRSDLTILMPTQNRPLFVERALRFYRQESLPYQIQLIDSSSMKNKATVKDIVKRSGLDVEFIDYEYELGANSFNKFDKTLSKIDTEYVLMVADDDFIFPSAINKCVDFLSRNKDYSAASGRSYLFELDVESDHSEIKSIELYPQLSAENDVAELRFKSHMRNWTPAAYSVQRTETLKEIIAVHRNFPDDIRMMEIHWYATNVIRGKVAKLDMPYMFRQITHSKEWSVDDFSDWSESLGFSEKNGVLISLLASELASKGSESELYYRRVCNAALRGWVKARRPFLFKNCFDYSINYYWSKFNEKTGLKNRIRGDLEAVARIRLAVET